MREKDALDHFDKVMGVYAITCLLTGHSYIGGSQNIKHRALMHHRALSTGAEHAKKLQAAWDEHGEGNFLITLLERVEDSIFLRAREHAWILREHPEYNGVQDGFVLSTLSEVKSDAAKKRWASPGFRERYSEARTGIPKRGHTASPKQVNSLIETGRISGMKRKHGDDWLPHFRDKWGYVPKRSQ